MSSSVAMQDADKSGNIRTTMLLTGILALLAIFVLWVLPRLPEGRLEFPSFNQRGTRAWILVSALGGVGCGLLLIRQIFEMKSRGIATSAKILSALATAMVCALWAYWLYGTATNRLSIAARTRSVTLTWQPSSSPIVGYYIYRSTISGNFADPPLNSSPITGTTFVDTKAAQHTTYYYVAVAVDASKNESPLSNVAVAAVP